MITFSILSFLFCFSSLKKASVGFEHMFEEVPIVIKNSHLISVLLWELEDKSTVADKHELLNLSSRSEKNSCNHLSKGPKPGTWVSFYCSQLLFFFSSDSHSMLNSDLENIQVYHLAFHLTHGLLCMFSSILVCFWLEERFYNEIRSTLDYLHNVFNLCF